MKTQKVCLSELANFLIFHPSFHCLKHRHLDLDLEVRNVIKSLKKGQDYSVSLCSKENQ